MAAKASMFLGSLLMVMAGVGGVENSVDVGALLFSAAFAVAGLLGMWYAVILINRD